MTAAEINKAIIKGSQCSPSLPCSSKVRFLRHCQHLHVRWIWCFYKQVLVRLHLQFPSKHLAAGDSHTVLHVECQNAGDKCNIKKKFNHMKLREKHFKCILWQLPESGAFLKGPAKKGNFSVSIYRVFILHAETTSKFLSIYSFFMWKPSA